ncbi:MAG: hypothetical protein ACQETB_02290 [Halobacteriota archaeon]
MFETIVLFASALFVLFLGIQIRFRGRVDLVAGPQPERIEDTEAFARYAGDGVLRIGMLTLAMAFVSLFGFDTLTIWLVYVGAVFVLMGVLVAGSYRFLGPVGDVSSDEEETGQRESGADDG